MIITKIIGAAVYQMRRFSRRSQTVIARSVRAARSWLLVPKSVQKSMYAGRTPGPGALAVAMNIAGGINVIADATTPAVLVFHEKSSWMMYRPRRVETSSVSKTKVEN